MVKVKSLRGTEEPSDLSRWVPATQGQGVREGGMDQDPETAARGPSLHISSLTLRVSLCGLG